MLKKLTVFQYMGGEVIRRIVDEATIKNVIWSPIFELLGASVGDMITHLQAQGLNSSMYRRMDDARAYLIIQDSDEFEFTKFHELGHLVLNHQELSAANEIAADSYALERVSLEQRKAAESFIKETMKHPLVAEHPSVRKELQSRLDNIRTYL